MSNKTIVLKLNCPKCGSPAHAEVKDQTYKFLLYVCPKCNSNVVHYDNKTDILSNEFTRSLAKEYNLQFSGQAIIPNKEESCEEVSEDTSPKITEDTILDLRILLNTETNFEAFLSKI